MPVRVMLGIFLSSTWCFIAAVVTGFVTTADSHQASRGKELAYWIPRLFVAGVAVGALSATSPMPFALLEAVAAGVPGSVAFLGGSMASGSLPKTWSRLGQISVICIVALALMLASWFVIISLGIELGGIAP